MIENLYRGYVNWKGWDDGTVSISPAEREVFRIEVGRTGLAPPAKVLEIGFGQGRFLDWARELGFDIVGIDALEPLCDSARARRHEVYCGDIVTAEITGPFDLIVAFDVIEHLTKQRLINVLAKMSTLLTAHGRILLRFPNGGSPFGRRYQHGDITHETAIAPDLIAQVAHICRLQLTFSGNAARPTLGRRGRLIHTLAYVLRDLVELLVGYVYFGQRIPLDPNLTAILKRA